MAFISTSPKSAGMKREPGTIPAARSCYPRERTAGNHVNACRHARTVVYRDARCPQHDGWQSNHAHPHLAGSRLHLNLQVLPEQSSAHYVLAHALWQESVYGLHQSPGANHSAEQAEGELIVESGYQNSFRN